jgi:putative hydrolase of the HAD superfamily
VLAGIQTDQRMADLVRRLRGRYKVALLSNASDSLPGLLDGALGLDGLFDVVVISALFGLAKPDPAIYHLTLDQLGVAPGEAVFIDDLPLNTAAATKLGIHGVHFVGYESLIQTLEELLSH